MSSAIKVIFAQLNYNKLLQILPFLVSILISVIIIWQSTFYRWFGYETIPPPITDEFNYVWQGLSLRSTGLPVAWTTISHVYTGQKNNPRAGNLVGFAMKSENTLINLQEFKRNARPIFAKEQMDYMKGTELMFFVAPFFDHPPLGGLIYSLGENSSIQTADQVKPDAFRKPALAIAIITAALLFIFIYIITQNPQVATLAVIVYSTVPTYLLATRTAFLENIEPPFILIHLILLFLGIKIYQKQTRVPLVIPIILFSGLFGGLAFLAKEPAIGFLIGSLILLIINKIPKKITFAFLLSASIPMLLYFAWGLWLQKDIFLDILNANATRGYFGALKPITMLEALKFKNFPVDGWWVWGLLSFVIVSLNIKSRNLLYLLLPLFTHYLLIMLIGSENYPWYLISLVPFLAGTAAIAIWQIYETPKIATAYAFFFIAFSSSYYWGRIALGLKPSIVHYRWIFLIFTSFLLARFFFGKYKFVRFIWFIFLAYLIYKSIIYNNLFLPYLVAHWGNLPALSLSSF
ncbi:MAG: hypothetical protein ACD_32C00111G0008 [uncultured bacterium]|uniref:Glycosyltransferase RgtA/B/C/D-like domain-containing protein n=1 Tax=Candidatus Daviesbacteria bacterium GW2011_GWC2_40_12 TaxID=1618431 RepID=A0A0G0TXE1_9BACT|nr:MAG: hypothetical protein ACD_32C00111G0008 [uncultured bacterium]KKR17228.1 MAG: hypothetical protein UT45_C0002G0057 [Candidatus Daviesbacteria bacterium GW2011_GWA2_39_33]KKR42627.1 MAG: hypothetical protein UT77_C0001G0078 [Candidatus Daviesbacteria bacterium GW2011_GWC2_40_12]OGE21303.1 MAG: hypothetical protein A2778_04000 [Candidatus Daviesbacteria bacterium RIFCSPHIGHO2_01_FULL_40_24]OGE30179.1 MAG: hypothetical protein A3C29_02120 [Candidatus Daviesbacteria bacterium RIFCSPHIGHO2_02